MTRYRRSTGCWFLKWLAPPLTTECLNRGFHSCSTRSTLKISISLRRYRHTVKAAALCRLPTLQARRRGWVDSPLARLVHFAQSVPAAVPDWRHRVRCQLRGVWQAPSHRQLRSHARLFCPGGTRRTKPIRSGMAKRPRVLPCRLYILPYTSLRGTSRAVGARRSRTPAPWSAARRRCYRWASTTLGGSSSSSTATPRTGMS